MHLLWVTGRRFGQDLCQTTQIQVANALSRIGWRVTFLAPDSPTSSDFVKAEGHGFAKGLKTSKIPGMVSFSFEKALRRKLPQLLEGLQPDVAVCDWRGARGAYRAFEKSGLAWAIIDRGPPASRSILGRLQWFHYDKAWRKAGQRANTYITVSKAHSEFVKMRFKLEGESRVLPAAADSTGFSIDKNRRESSRPGIDRPLRLVYHGRLDRSRRVTDLVFVANQLQQSGIETSLRMFGTGTAVPKLTKLAKKHEWLELLPKQKPANVPDLLSNVDVGLLPMDDRLVWATSSPLKLFEYAASGLAIVATDIAAHRIIGEPDWIGLVPVSSMIDGMVRKLQEWVVDERIYDLGQAARIDFENQFTWDDSIKDMVLGLSAIAQLDNTSE